MIKRLPMVLCMCLLFTCTVQAAQREDTEEFRAKYQLWGRCGCGYASS